MTVVNPKSISGINSITTGSGSDNLLTIHTSDASSTERVRINSSGDVIVGSGITVSPDGDIFATGVCTATTFSGSGASLTNLPAANITGTLPAISGANLTNLDASDLASGTVPTARLGSGTASSSTFLRGDSTFAAVTSTTINNNADNRVITGSGSANTLEGEANLVFNGNELSISNTNPQFKLTDTTNNTDAFLFSDDNGSIRLAADLNSEASDSRIRMSTDGTERVSIAEHLTISDGNLVIGTSGHGIDFSATGDGSGTMTNELLDDYEEGTWSISVTPGGGSFGVSHMNARYVRIGNVVTVQGWWRTNDISGVSGSLTVSGLPYAALDYSSGGGVRQNLKLDVAHVNYSNLTFVIFRVGNNSTQGTILGNTAGASGGFQTWTAGNVAVSTELYISGSYITG